MKTKLFFMSVYGGNTLPINDLQLTEKQYKELLKSAVEDLNDTYPTEEEKKEMSASVEKWQETKDKITKTTTKIIEGCCCVRFEKYELNEKGYQFNLKEKTPKEIKIMFDYSKLNKPNK